MSKIVDAHTGIYKLQKDSLFSEKEYLNNQEVNKNFMDVVAKRKALYADRIESGESEVSVPMGGSAFTDTQWKKLMESVDLAIAEMRYRIRVEKRASQIRQREKREKAKKLYKLRLRVREQIIHREISSNFYSLKIGRDGTFIVNNKVTSHQYTFVITNCRIQSNPKTGAIFLMSTEAYETTGCIEVDEVLKSMLERFFVMEELNTEELTT